MRREWIRHRKLVKEKIGKGCILCIWHHGSQKLSSMRDHCDDREGVSQIIPQTVWVLRVGFEGFFCFGFRGFGFEGFKFSGTMESVFSQVPRTRTCGLDLPAIPRGSIVVPSCGSYTESYKVIPKRNYYGAYG